MGWFYYRYTRFIEQFQKYKNQLFRFDYFNFLIYKQFFSGLFGIRRFLKYLLYLGRVWNRMGRAYFYFVTQPWNILRLNISYLWKLLVIYNELLKILFFWLNKLSVVIWSLMNKWILIHRFTREIENNCNYRTHHKNIYKY